MKTITYSQKKWALTGCLLLALGFNLSISKHAEGVASADLASSSDDVVDAKVATANGVATVKYIKLSDTQTLAHVTEGSICATCGKDFTLDMNFNKDNVDALNVALLKYVSATPAVTPAVVASSNEETSADLTAKALSSIEKSCDKKSENQDKLECYGDKFTTLMGKKHKVELDQDKLMDFYKDHIESLVQDQINESRRLLSKARRAAVNPALNFGDLDDSADPAQMRADALKVVEQLLGGIPKKYEPIRKRLVTYETALLRAEATDVQQTFVQSRQTTNPVDSVRLMQEAFLKRQDLNYLANGINDANQYGFDKAARYSNISTTDADTYYQYFNSYAKQIIDGLALNPNNFQIPGSAVQLNGNPLAGRIGTGRVGNGALTTPAPLAAPTPIPGATLTLASPANGSVSFGEQQAVTADMIKMRDAIRNTYNLH